MREGLRFSLNGRPVHVDGLAPDVTLLDWLRLERGLTGTKEGCNEGDCGACTVAVTRMEDGKPVRRAVNACIVLLPMVDGAEVTTVEGIAAPDGRPHSCQQAMVDLHGSQCGFCTPGFVMSLWAAFPDGRRERGEINDILAGNLCRCTGYGPIVAAADAMHDLDPPDWEADAGRILAALEDDGPARIEGGGRIGLSPRTLDELADACEEHPRAVLVSGATDVGLWITKQLREPEVMIFLNRVEGLDRIEEDEDGLTLGAGVTYSRAMPALTRLAPDLGELMRRLGSVQVRNSGTVGGNIANGSPIGDSPPALIALGAEVTLRKGGEWRSLPLEDFFIDYGRQDRALGEFVESVRIPRPADPEALRCYKVSKRFDQDITAVLGCFNIRVEEGRVASARIAYGGMAATPKRARAAEAALEGEAWNEEAARRAAAALAEDFAPIDDMRASAGYRARVAGNLLLRAYHESREPLERTRLVGRGAAAA